VRSSLKDASPGISCGTGPWRSITQTFHQPAGLAVTIKSLSPATRQRVQSLFAYLASSFPGSSLDEAFESVDTDAVFMGINRWDKGWLFVGLSAPTMTRAKKTQLPEIAAGLDLAAVLGRASEKERIWIDVDGPTGYRLRVTNKDDHSPEHGSSIA